jgi:hypothetical protein
MGRERLGFILSDCFNEWGFWGGAVRLHPAVQGFGCAVRQVPVQGFGRSGCTLQSGGTPVGLQGQRSQEDICLTDYICTLWLSLTLGIRLLLMSNVASRVLTLLQ